MMKHIFFWLYCKKNSSLRSDFVHKIISEEDDINFNTSSDNEKNEKIKFLLCPSTPKKVEKNWALYKTVIRPEYRGFITLFLIFSRLFVLLYI